MLATDADRIKAIADNIEASHQALRRSARNLSGLLALNRATCTELRAYNLWALAAHKTHRGMIAALKQAGEVVPELPPPTLFAKKNAPRETAFVIDCGVAGDLRPHDAMALAMRGPQPRDLWLSSQEIVLSTVDPHVFEPEKAPDPAAPKQLHGMTGVVIAVAAIGVVVTIGASALLSYLQRAQAEEAGSQAIKQQAEAFDQITANRLCFETCLASGKSQALCTQSCHVSQGTSPIVWLALGLGILGLGTYAAWYYVNRHEQRALSD